MSLQQKIDRITDILRRDDGISGAMHYTEQTSWVLFLKFLDDYESEKEDEAVLSGKDYQPVLDDEHRWASWACPKAADGKLDLARAKTGDDLTDYVNNQLFPYLKSFANAAATGADPKSFTYKIGAIFQYLDNKVASGHTLREVLDIVDSLNFQSESDLFELSLVYEGLLQNMGDAGGYAGEFYTPRPVVRAMVQAIDPQPGETIYDAAAGSCGFLVEAFEHLKSKKNQLSTEQWDFIQRDTFFGFEKTSLAYVISVQELTYAANQINSVLLTKPFEVFALLALTYFILNFGLSALVHLTEKRIGSRRAGRAPVDAAAGTVQPRVGKACLPPGRCGIVPWRLLETPR